MVDPPVLLLAVWDLGDQVSDFRRAELNVELLPQDICMVHWVMLNRKNILKVVVEETMWFFGPSVTWDFKTKQTKKYNYTYISKWNAKLLTLAVQYEPVVSQLSILFDFRMLILYYLNSCYGLLNYLIWLVALVVGHLLIQYFQLLAFHLNRFTPPLFKFNLFL